MGKNIVVCCDGTGNKYGPNNTNVAKLFDIVEKHSAEQIAFYDPGVGTSAAFPVVTYVGRAVFKFIGGAFGYGITRNIEDAYAYLMDRYEVGDRVFIFGFSRGAFTARALAGMLHRVGLLYPGSKNLIGYASELFKSGLDTEAAGFKRAFSRECKPHFVGVWDTVKSVGLFITRRFGDEQLNPDIRFGYHAISIDERRRMFLPSLWGPPTSTQRIVQVWFPGVHSDVGGSYVEAGLSDIALKWMLEQAARPEIGLLVDSAKLSVIEGDPEGTIHNSLTIMYRFLGWKRRKVEVPPEKNGDPVKPIIHDSVQERLDAEKMGYKPKNLLRLNRSEYVLWSESEFAGGPGGSPSSGAETAAASPAAAAQRQP